MRGGEMLTRRGEHHNFLSLYEVDGHAGVKTRLRLPNGERLYYLREMRPDETALVIEVVDVNLCRVILSSGGVFYAGLDLF